MALSAKAQSIKERYSEATDLNHRLSYSNGVTSIVGMRQTNQTIRTRITNTMETPQRIYILPSQIVGTDVPTNKSELFGFLGLSTSAIPFFVPETDAVSPATGKVTIISLDATQNLRYIANSANNEPFNIVGVSMKSYRSSDGSPENTNYGNSITRYHVSAWKEKRRATPLNFQDFQSSKDFSTEIMKIDFIKEKFVAPVSQSDVLEILINPGTVLDFTMHIGARDSQTERFYRDVEAGTALILNEFQNQVEPKKICGC